MIGILAAKGIWVKCPFNQRVRLKEGTPHQHKHITWSNGQPPALVKSTIARMGKKNSGRLRSLPESVY